MATRSWSRNSAAMTLAPAALDVDFKQCCMKSKHFDGRNRDHFFQGLKAVDRNEPLTRSGPIPAG